jgi:hypothetical protein
MHKEDKMNPSFMTALRSVAAFALVGGLLFGANAQAGIIAINTPGTSTASITFDDTFSVVPPAGITNSGPSASPWNGSLLTMPLTTDTVTGDFASGDIDATFVFSGNTYAINFNNVTLNQVGANTGFAHLNFAFNVEFQLDAAGLPLQAPLYPNFLVNGTVQNIPGSFAAVGGFIDYSGVNTAGTYSVLETVKYGSTWTTPGNFIGTAFGVPVNGFTPALVGNTTLTLNGFISFQVDPASINAYSVQGQAVPEPATMVLLAPLFAVLLRRRG